jgi:hypothetical protein
MSTKFDAQRWHQSQHFENGPEGAPVPWRTGYWLPGRWKTTFEAADSYYIVELEFTTASARGPSCRTVRLAAKDGAEITVRGIQAVPLGKLIQLAIGTAALEKDPHPRYDPTTGNAKPAFYIGGVTGFVPARGVDRFKEPRDVRTTDARLQEVAEVYKAAQPTSKPTQAVQAALFTSYPTAARLVGEARRRGFLPPTDRKSPKRKDQP